MNDKLLILKFLEQISWYSHNKCQKHRKKYERLPQKRVYREKVSGNNSKMVSSYATGF